MFKLLSIIGLAEAREEMKRLTQSQHPVVLQSGCKTSVDRLKYGPANIPDVIAAGTTFTDTDFEKFGALYWSGYTDSVKINDFDNKITTTKEYWWQRWPEVFKDADIFGPNTDPTYIDPVQGEAGTCYIMTAMSSLAEFPQYIKDIFITDKKNSAGIIGLRFFIRGKPWVVTVDDQMLFMFPNNPKLKFAQPDPTNKIMWGAILEKGWAKVKGTYSNADGGFQQTGLRSVVGVPVFSYKTSTISNADQAKAAWDLIKAADDAKYLINVGTDGDGDN